MEVSRFVEKLNKVAGNVYVIEEEVHLTDGAYEAVLEHDNINPATLAVFTGPKLTGERVQSYALSTPSLTPWKKVIRVYADVPVVYISYETDGDMVEAEDINRVQDEIGMTQEALNTEAARAEDAEQTLGAALSVEVGRAELAEKKLMDDLEAERVRAEAAETILTDNLSIETERAKEAEKKIAEGLSAETSRAIEAESANSRAIAAEADRAKAKEAELQAGTQAERARAEAAEASIESTISTNKPNWDTAFSHVSNKSNPHGVTKSQIGLGSVPNVPTNDQTPTYTTAESLENIISGEKLSLSLGKIRKAIADFISHKADAVIHVTASERTKWNAVDSKVDKVSGKQLSANDYTTADKNKLAGIMAGAEVNVQSDWAVTDSDADSYIKNKPASMPASDVSAWAKAQSKPAYGWTEITGKPTAFAPATHTHARSQITDMPTKVSQFTNDAGYITQADVDTSQDHTHGNKTVLDKLTQVMLDKLAGIAEGANKYVHPTTSGNKHIPAGGASGQFLKWSADGTAVWAADNNTTYSAFKAATASAAGGPGLVPAPAAGAQAKYLRGDGTWAVPEGITYIHPNSGVTAGTYRSVTVNAQGHVTAGTNPTTLAGYGITDAAAKNHNHDSIYLKKGPITWGDLKGV